LFILSNSTQVPSLEAFIIYLYMYANSLKYDFYEIY